MNIGNKIYDLRKKQALSRYGLGRIVGTSGAKVRLPLDLLQKISKKERESILYFMDSLLQTAQITITQQKLM